MPLLLLQYNINCHVVCLDSVIKAMGMKCRMPTNHVLPSCFQLEIALVIGKHQNHSFKTQLDTILDARTNHEQLQKN